MKVQVKNLNLVIQVNEEIQMSLIWWYDPIKFLTNVTYKNPAWIALTVVKILRLGFRIRFSKLTQYSYF